jgi:hypothetical protein
VLLYFRLLIGVLRRSIRARRDLLVENLVLRQQLAVYARQRRRPALRNEDRIFWSIVEHQSPFRASGQGDAFYDLVFRVELLTAGERRIVGAFDVADANLAALDRLRYDFGDGTVRQSDTVTNLQVEQIHSSPRSLAWGTVSSVRLAASVAQTGATPCAPVKAAAATTPDKLSPQTRFVP